MRSGDLLREAWKALAASRSRTLLTGAGVTVGTLALTLILSHSLGLSAVLDQLVSTDQQLRQVVVLPGFGARARRGPPPPVEGEMSEEKRARLRRSLGKRGRGGSHMGGFTRGIDAETEAELAAIPEVEFSLPFLQERFDLALAGSAGADDVEPDRPVLSLAVRAEHPYYPLRLLGGRWFESDDERGVVVHELLLYDMGFTSDAQQAALVGRTIRLTSRETKRGNSYMEMIFGGNGGARKRSTAPVKYVEELPLLGVIRERFGMEPASVVEEAWAMQSDVFLPIGLARELWDRHENRDPPRGLLLVADTMDGVPAIEEAVRKKGLQVRSVREVVERVKQMLAGVTVMAMFLAGIAVFVAALGIVNTMVMSVLERTREIGLLKALGATDRDVARLFMAEAALLGLAGGVVGVVVAYGLSLVGDAFGRQRISEMFFMPFEGSLFHFPPWLAGGGLAFALVTSLVAALIPALRASRVDPVEALRHE